MQHSRCGFLEVYLSQRLSCWVVLALLFAAGAPAQETRVVLDRGGSTIVLEPYAPNIIRVTLSLLKQPALAPPGYGFTAAPSAAGWSHQQSEQGDTYQSGRLTVTVAANRPGTGKPLPTATGYRQVLQRLGSRSAHYLQHGGRNQAARYAGLGDGGAQP